VSERTNELLLAERRAYTSIQSNFAEREGSLAERERGISRRERERERGISRRETGPHVVSPREVDSMDVWARRFDLTPPGVPYAEHAEIE
jgi:hypothetical protein